MLGYIIVDFKIFDQGTEEFRDRFEDLPYCAFYSKLDINPTAPPNPFTDLVHDANLSDLVRELINTYSGGSYDGFNVQFVDVVDT